MSEGPVSNTQPELDQWRYQPEFVKNADGSIRRVGPPTYVHSSGASVSISATTNLHADMLTIEGRDDAAAKCRVIASGRVAP